MVRILCGLVTPTRELARGINKAQLHALARALVLSTTTNTQHQNETRACVFWSGVTSRESNTLTVKFERVLVWMSEARLELGKKGKKGTKKGERLVLGSAESNTFQAEEHKDRERKRAALLHQHLNAINLEIHLHLHHHRHHHHFPSCHHHLRSQFVPQQALLGQLRSQTASAFVTTLRLSGLAHAFHFINAALGPLYEYTHLDTAT